MKRVVSLLLVLALAALLLTPALADEPLSMLPAVNDYAAANYTDVPAGSWYAQAAQVCYETGLIMGTQSGFEPELTLTGGQLAAIAARLREAIVGDSIPAPAEGAAWYQPYLDYLQAAGVTAPDPEKPASRLEFAQLLCAVLPESYTPAVNAVSALPDCDDAQVLRLYNAGVLTGSDAYGTFSPDATLCRHECAAMVARVVRPDLRRQFTLEAPPAQQEAPDPPLSYEEELLQTEALRVNGQSIPFSLFLDTLNQIIFRTDFSLAANGGSRLDWDAQYQGIDDLGSYFISLALDQAVREFLIASRAKALSCAEDALPQTLTPDPSAALDKVYRAKHILVKDEATASAVLAQLMASPSLERFDQLMAQYNTDPGMSSNPDGYLFTDGDMVAPFENAVKALNIGSCSSAPVQSDFGWHIILRLDPKGYPDWERSVQSLLYEHYLEEWVSSSTVTPNNVELGKLDVRGRYEKYLADMGL